MSSLSPLVTHFIISSAPYLCRTKASSLLKDLSFTSQGFSRAVFEHCRSVRSARRMSSSANFKFTDKVGITERNRQEQTIQIIGLLHQPPFLNQKSMIVQQSYDSNRRCYHVDDRVQESINDSLTYVPTLLNRAIDMDEIGGCQNFCSLLLTPMSNYSLLTLCTTSSKMEQKLLTSL